MRWLESPDLSAALIAFFAMLGTILGGGTVTQMLHRKKNPTAPPPDFAEVKGAIISDKSVERIVQSFDASTASSAMFKTSIDRDVEAKQALTKSLIATSATMERLITCLGANGEVLRSNTNAANAVASEAHDLRTEIGDLAKELEIQSRLRRSKE